VERVSSGTFSCINSIANQSQRDRKLVIKSLGFYMDEFGPLMNQTEWMEVNALLKWIELEYYKNEN
jgi:hypothetical protein